MGKLFTCILNHRLSKWAEDEQIFSQFQYGFRTGRSTVDCLFIITAALQKCFNNGDKLYCAFVDLKRAFDGTNRRAMWFKLEENNVSSKMLKIIKALYNKMKMFVRVNNSENQINSSDSSHQNRVDNFNGNIFANNQLSENESFFTTSSGVLQGESLSPFLFSMFINDIEKCVKNNDHEIGLEFENLLINLLLFADDMAIFSKSIKGLQKGLNNLETYCDEWGLTVNTTKTKCMVFKKGGKLNVRERWKYKGVDLETVSDFRYLGLVLGSSGSFAKSVSDLAIRGNRALFGLKRIFCKNSYLDIKLQLDLFNTLVEPVMSYSCEVWGLRESDQLEKIHLGFLKNILGVRKSTPSAFVYRELGLYPLILKRKIRVVKYWLKILELNNDNPVRNIYDSLLLDLNANGNITNWTSLVRDLLFTNGFGYAWLNQSVPNANQFIQEFTLRIKCSFEQNVNMTIDNLSTHRLYRNLDQNHSLKSYLLLLDKNKRIALAKIRLGSHNFKIERGRWQKPKVDFNDRTCPSCDCIEDEYHALVECPRFADIRSSYLDKSLKKKPSMFKFVQLLDSTSKQKLEKNSQLILRILNNYDSNI